VGLSIWKVLSYTLDHFGTAEPIIISAHSACLTAHALVIAWHVNINDEWYSGIQLVSVILGL